MSWYVSDLPNETLEDGWILVSVALGTGVAVVIVEAVVTGVVVEEVVSGRTVT